MIRVNLLPLDRRPIRRSPIPYIVSIAVLVAGVLGVAALYVTTQAQVLQKRAELAASQERLAALDEIITESDSLEKLKEQLASKIDTIVEITSDRILWSRQLYNLSRLAPDNIWYSGVKVDAKSFKEQRQEYNPKTKQLETKVITITRPILRVSGYVAPADDGTVDVSPLMQATERDEEFASMFELEPPSFRDDEFENVPVRVFSLEYLIKTEEAQG